METASETTPAKREAGVRCPVIDCQIPVDVTFRSSDQQLIGAHQANMAQFSAGFPSPEDVTHSDEVVYLSERGDVLSLLMQFVHNHKFPTLFDATPESIFELANTSEKYMVHAAMNACAINIREIAKDPEYSLQSLIYAIDNDYPDIADNAAPGTIHRGLGTIKEKLKGNVSALLAWVSFREQYLVLIKTVLKPPPNDDIFSHFAECTAVKNMLDSLREKLKLPGCPYDALSIIGKDREHRLLDADMYLAVWKCPKPKACKLQVRMWFSALKSSLRPFSTFRT